MKDYPVSKNQDLTVTIIDLTYEGLGVAKVEGYPIFIENALVDEEVEIHVLKVGKHFGYGKVTKWIKKSPDRQPIDNTDLIRTGIAPLAHLNYDKQLVFKQQQVENDLHKIAKLNDIPVLPTLGMTNPVGYRNKAQVPVRKLNDRLETGFYRKNSHDLVPIENFVIQDPKIDEALLVIKDLLRKFAVKPYNEEKHSGFLRHIVIRRGHYSHEMMVTFVTNREKFFNGKDLAQLIAEKLPEIVSVIQNVNDKKTNVIFGEKEHILYGKRTIEDTLLGKTYRISSKSFYQVNTAQAEVLYQTAIDFAQLTKEDVVVDAYCGIGTIGLSLAEKVSKVYGMEVIPEAVEDARENAEINGVTNAVYEAGMAEDVMAQWLDEGVKPTVVFVDPPRKGLTEPFIESVAKAAPERVVYISCNPATLARDVKHFDELGYGVRKVQPIDLFCQTQHVETCVLLSKASE